MEEEYRRMQMEEYQRRKEEFDLAMKAQKEKEQKEAISKAMLQSMAAQGGMGKFQSPEIQGLLRPFAAAQGDPAMLEQGGLLAPQAAPRQPSENEMLYAIALQQGYRGTMLDFLKEKSGKENKPRIVEQGGIQYYADTGKPVLPGVTPPVDTGEKFTQEKALRGEIGDKTKSFTQIQESFGRIAATAQDPSPAGDMALIFNFMKMLDPGSTVREGEYANAQNAAGIPERIRGMFNRARDGESLTPAQRADFLRQSSNIYRDASAGYQSTLDYYKGLSGSYGVDPARVLTPPPRYQPDQLQAIIDEAAAYISGQRP
jgi:hypothetical protein